MFLHRLPQASLCACALELTILSVMEMGPLPIMLVGDLQNNLQILHTHSVPSHKIRAIARAQYRDNGHFMAHPLPFGVSDQCAGQYRPKG